MSTTFTISDDYDPDDDMSPNADPITEYRTYRSHVQAGAVGDGPWQQNLMKKKPETGQWFFEPNGEDEELARDIRYIYTLLADDGYFKTRWGKKPPAPRAIADAIAVVACKPLADFQYGPLFQMLLRKLEQDVKVNEVISHINAELSSLSHADRDNIWGALTDFLEDLISGRVKVVPSTDRTDA